MKRSSMIPMPALAATALALAAFAAPVQAESAAAGAFSAEQAARGTDLYENYCGACHGFDLVATDSEAATLTGGAFSFSWHRTTINERFERISSSMPPGAGGMLEPQEYLDIITYILSFNGYPAGDAELTPEGLGAAEIAVGRP